MTVFAEFVGGPLGGEVQELPDARDRWYVDRMPMIGGLTAVVAPELPPEPSLPLIYERVGRRTVNAPTGEPVFRFRLLGPP